MESLGLKRGKNFYAKFRQNPELGIRRGQHPLVVGAHSLEGVWLPDPVWEQGVRGAGDLVHLVFFRLRGDTPKECVFLFLRFLIHLQPSKVRKSSRGRLAHNEIYFSGISWSLGFHSEEVQDLVFQMIFACDCLYSFPMAFF